MEVEKLNLKLEWKLLWKNLAKNVQFLTKTKLILKYFGQITNEL